MRKITADENFTTILEYYYFLLEITIDTNYVQSIHVICLLSLRIVPFFFLGFVWITSFSATVGRRAIGLKPPGRSHQAFHSQTSRWKRPTQSQRPCQARWLNCQLWHRVSWKAVDGHPRPISKSSTRKMKWSSLQIKKSIYFVLLKN